MSLEDEWTAALMAEIRDLFIDLPIKVQLVAGFGTQRPPYVNFYSEERLLKTIYLKRGETTFEELREQVMEELHKFIEIEDDEED